MSFKAVFKESKVILTEGAFVERIKAEFGIKTDPHVNHAGLIYSHPQVLELLYRQYLDIGKKYMLPILVMTPTRKVNAVSVGKSAYSDKDISADTVASLNKIKQSYGDYAEQIFLGGLMGCRGDAYSGQKVMDVEEAYRFHRKQALALSMHNIDFLFAGIMPEINEATGMAMAMAETDLPYIVSFMVRKSGNLLDGTSIADAIERIDAKANPKPVCYMANCIHPSNLLQALLSDQNTGRAAMGRLRGIQSNASMLSPEELNNCPVLHQDDFSHIIDEMMVLHDQHAFNVFGGCCGTNDLFLESLAQKLMKTSIMEINK
ncbi:MAG: homocysteine S-methyltransferase family protein [Bacteroidetes bacterium]|nr:homocysteine S-methyltransferase family protein [Bacteroidota bacterium]